RLNTGPRGVELAPSRDHCFADQIALEIRLEPGLTECLLRLARPRIDLAAFIDWHANLAADEPVEEPLARNSKIVIILLHAADEVDCRIELSSNQFDLLSRGIDGV